MSGHPSQQDAGSVWIKSEPADDGTYRLVLELSQDDVIPLSDLDAWGWIKDMQVAMATAEYDEAVIKQLGALAGQDAAITCVASLRKRRPTFHTMAKLDLTLVPGISAFTGKAYVQIVRGKQSLGQWARADVDRHTLGVIGALASLPLDEQYLAFLTSELDLDRGRALSVVTDLYNHRDHG